MDGWMDGCMCVYIYIYIYYDLYFYIEFYDLRSMVYVLAASRQQEDPCMFRVWGSGT